MRFGAEGNAQDHPHARSPTGPKVDDEYKNQAGQGSTQRSPSGQESRPPGQRKAL